MNRNALTLVIMAGLFIIMLIAAGCAGRSPTEAEAEKLTLTIGVLGPFTGSNSDIGEEFKGAVKMAFANADKKIGDYYVEFVWIDSQSDPKRATLAYEEAAAEKDIDAGILNWHSSVAVAAMNAAARNEVPHFFGFGATGIINEKYEYNPDYYSYWMGKTWPSPEKLTGAYVEALQEAVEKGYWVPSGYKVGIYGEDTEWGKSFGAAIASEFEEAGWDIVGEAYFPTGATELTVIMDSLKAMEPDVLAGSVATPSSLASFLEQARNYKLQSIIIADGLGWVGEWYDITGSASNYVLGQSQPWIKEEAKQFVNDFEEKFGFTPSTSSAGLAYDMACFFIQVAEEALEEHGELNRDTLYRYGQEKLWTGKTAYTNGIIMDKYVYSPDTVPDPVVGEGYFIFPVVQFFEGEKTIIWPETWKEAEFELPDYLADQ